MSVNFVVVNEIMIWYNIERYYTSANSHSTEGRIITTANCVHPRREHVGTTWYNIRRILPALICRPTGGRTISLANHAHPPKGKRINALSMSRRHGIISTDIIPAPVRRPTKGRTSSLANRVHAPQGKNMSE